MIKSKTCKECDRPAFSKGLCQIHQPKKGIKSSRELTKEKSAVKQEKRNSYFDYHLEKCTRSEESFKQISNPTRANICHIFPKRKYKSIEDNLLNYVYLSLEEHSNFDKLIDSLMFEELENRFSNCWNTVCERALQILPLIEEEGIIKREFAKYLKYGD